MTEKRLSVLIIEDEQVYRTLALQVFEGCEKIVAANATEGLAKFKEFSPDITLVDIGLPDKNGLDLLVDLMGYDPEAFIVMLTMSRVSNDVKMAKERGAAGYIIKPFSHKKVSDCIAKYKEYKKKLQEMTPEERAGKMVESLKVEALHDDLNKHLEETLVKHKESNHYEEDAVDQLIKSWHVLFADDFLINRERAEVQLSKMGCAVDIAENGADILKKMSKQHYNIALIDSKLNDMTGYDVAKEIRKMEGQNGKEDRSLLVIMVEDETELDRHLWQKAGMNDFIKKPASFTRLKEMIHKHAKQIIDLASEEYV